MSLGLVVSEEKSSMQPSDAIMSADIKIVLHDLREVLLSCL